MNKYRNLRFFPILLTILLLEAACGSLPQPGKSSVETAAAKAAAAHKLNPLPDNHPLTNDDVDLYVSVMKAAVERVEKPDKEDRKAMDFLRQMNSGERSLPNRSQKALLTRGTELASADSAIARERGVAERYMAVKARIESTIGPLAGAGEQKTPDPRYASVRNADLALLEPRRAEIEPLQITMRNVLMPVHGSR
jgi:hypothetical protein